MLLKEIFKYRFYSGSIAFKLVDTVYVSCFVNLPSRKHCTQRICQQFIQIPFDYLMSNQTYPFPPRSPIQLWGTISDFLSLLPKQITSSPTPYSLKVQYVLEYCPPLVTFVSHVPTQDGVIYHNTTCHIGSFHVTSHLSVNICLWSIYLMPNTISGSRDTEKRTLE